MEFKVDDVLRYAPFIFSSGISDVDDWNEGLVLKIIEERRGYLVVKILKNCKNYKIDEIKMWGIDWINEHCIKDNNYMKLEKLRKIGIYEI